MRRLSDSVKIGIAIPPTQISSSGSTSPYFDMGRYSRIMFVWNVAPADAAASLSTSIGLLYQATDHKGTGAVAIAGSTATLTYYTKASEFTLTPAILTAGTTVSITGYDLNGDAVTALTFTAADGGTAGTTASARTFSYNDTAAGTGIASNACTTLAAILNNASYGVPGLYATASSTNVTCRAVDPGLTVFSITSSDTADLTLAVTKALAISEINASSLTISSSFTHVALNVINAVSAWTSAIAIREGRREIMPVQMAGVLDTVGE